MSSPQVENGFVRIATELQRELCRFRIPGEARQVFDAILLKTYGFNKKEDAISLSQLADMTGLQTSEVCRALRKLVSMNLIGKKASSSMNIWQVNKHYHEWKVLAKKPLANSPLAKKPKGTGESANQVLAKKPDTIDTLTKDNLQKKLSSAASAATDITTKKLPAHMEPMAVFALATGIRFDNREQLSSFIDRNLRASKSLKGYTPEQILRAYAVAYRESKKLGNDVTLETVGKKIDLYKNAEFPPGYQETCNAILQTFHDKKDILLSQSSPLCTTQN
jgi:phage replication O-like protein O